MKKLLLLILLCCLVAVLGATAGVVTLSSPSKALPKVTALTAAETAAGHIASGKSALGTDGSQNIIAARNFFAQAVAVDPNNQEANFLYAVTRIFAVFEQNYGATSGLNSVKEIFERSGFTFSTFGLYSIEATDPAEIAATMPRTGDVISFIDAKLLPELNGAVSNLEKVISTSFSSTIAPSALNTYGDSLQADYADVLAVKALVHLLRCNLNLLVVYGPDVHIPDFAAAPDQLMTYKQLLANDAKLLTPNAPARLTTAKEALISFIDTYNLAATRLQMRSGGRHHLFVADVPWYGVTNEPIDTSSDSLTEVSQALATVKASLYGPQTFPGDQPVQYRHIDLSKLFNAAAPISIRANLSDCAGSKAFPDETFGGLFPLGLSLQDAIYEMGPHMLGLTCADKAVPFIDVDQHSLYIQDGSGYSSGPATVEISNKGTRELRVSSISLAGFSASDFTVVPSTSPSGCASLTPTLAIGASCTVSVDLKRPAVNSEFVEAELNIASDDPTNRIVTIWVSGYVPPTPAGPVTGKMKDAATLQGIPGAVYFYDARYYGWEKGSASVDASGRFSISGLNSGTYKVKFIANDNYYAEQWFQGKLTADSADSVILTSAATTLPDAAMVKGGIIEGTVKDAETKQGLQSILLWLYDPQTNQSIASGYSDSNGGFSIPRVPPGTYSLEIGDSSDQWLPAGSTVKVTAENTTQTGDILLSKGATITGAIRDAGNQSPIYEAGVMLYQSQSGEFVASTVTDYDGAYIISGLPSGSYKIFFAGNRQGYQRLWHSNAASRETATPVTVAAPNTVTINAVLAKVVSTETSLTSQISGGTVTLTATVTSRSGIPAGGVTFFKEQVKLGTAQLDATGKATFTAQLPPGTHTISATYSGNSSFNISSARITQVVQQQDFTLSVSAGGDGSGSVHSDPQGIACAKGSSTNCSKSFTGWSQVTLWPTPTAGSVFSNWSGACSGTGSCVVTMSGAKSVTATFGLADATVRIDGVSTRYYRLGDALGVINANGKSVSAKNHTFTEQLILNVPYEVMLKGGYSDTAFSTRTGFTTLSGSVKIRQGKLWVERLKVR